MAIQWNKNEILENLPVLQMQLESIQSALENVNSQENINDLIHNYTQINEKYLVLTDRISATFNKANNQIVEASAEDIEKISKKLAEFTIILDNINESICVALSLISKISLNNQNNSQIALQNENYEIALFEDIFTQFSATASEVNPKEIFEKLVNFHKKLEEYSLKKTHYLNSENNSSIPSLLKQTTQWMQTIISNQEKIEKEHRSELEKMDKEQSEKENDLTPFKKLQRDLEQRDSDAVDKAFKELESEDKKKLLAELNKILLENKTITRPLQVSILGQPFSIWSGSPVEKITAIKNISLPVKESILLSAKPKIETQFLAEKMAQQMKEALGPPLRNDNRPVNNHNNSNEIVPITDIGLTSVSNFTMSCQPPLPLGSVLFIRGIDGNWDKGIPLLETQSNLWKFHAKQLGNQECKFLINDDVNFWEKLNGNRKIVNGELINTQGAVFEKIPEGLEENLDGFVIFVNFGFDENKYKIAICGENIEESNDWDEKNPLLLANSEGCWSVQIHKRAITKPIHFKYVLVPKNGGKLIWEQDLPNSPNRTIGNMLEPKF